jgi:hypothetical protein
MYRKCVPPHWTRSNEQETFQRKEDKNGMHIHATKQAHCTVKCHLHAGGGGVSQGWEDTSDNILSRVGIRTHCETTF